MENLATCLYKLETDEFKKFALDAIKKHGTATMWDAYCSKGGARIKTTIGKFNNLCKKIKNYRFIHGCVGYSPDCQPRFSGTYQEAVLKNLFVKRISFFHENEYRYIAFRDSDYRKKWDELKSNEKPNLFIEIDDLGDFIDEILIFPNKDENKKDKKLFQESRKLYDSYYPIIHNSLIKRGLEPTINSKDGNQFCRISQLYEIISQNVG